MSLFCRIPHRSPCHSESKPTPLWWSRGHFLSSSPPPLALTSNIPNILLGLAHLLGTLSPDATHLFQDLTQYLTNDATPIYLPPHTPNPLAPFTLPFSHCTQYLPTHFAIYLFIMDVVYCLAPGKAGIHRLFCSDDFLNQCLAYSKAPGKYLSNLTEGL